MRLRMQRAAASCTGASCRARPSARAEFSGNQAWLRRAASSPPDATTTPAAPPTTATPSTTPTAALSAGPSAPTQVDVWGLQINRGMCGCKDAVRGSIAWANTAAAAYAACDTPANATGAAVETCFSGAQPTAVVNATTNESGVITLPPASANPCDKIDNKTALVHETMHARHQDTMAQALGAAFFHAWKALAGDPARLDKIRIRFPAETAAYEARWQSGSDWAKDEVHSYTWERRFLEDALRALNRIC